MNVRRWSGALTATILLGACAEPAPHPGSPLERDGTPEMVARLASLAAGLDRRRSPFANEARAAQIVARGPEPSFQGVMVYRGQLAEQILYAGRFREAVDSLRSLLRDIDARGARVPAEYRTTIAELEVQALLKLEEQRSCVEAREVERCLLPVTGLPPRPDDAPAREAARALEALLERDPSSLQNRWLLNVCSMMLGEYPGGVPDRWLVPPGSFASEHELERFPDRAAELGLDDVGHAGGAIMDDFDRDGDLDVMTTGWLLGDQMLYHENDGAGGFVDRTAEAGLTGLVGGLNMKHADFDNDGFLDVLVLRGAWLPYGQPNSLLRNRGDGSFEDVTEAAGLLSASSTQTADWGDFDNDGWVDLFIGNESSPGRREPSRLFRNNGDGTFTDVAPEVGVDVVGFVKASAWGDYDNDGDPDLYVGRMGATNLLFRNDPAPGPGVRAFVEVGGAAGVGEPAESFSLWFWDYDNDGWLDLYVGGYRASVGDVAAEHLGQPHQGETPRLYRNRGDGTFEDVTAATGLDRIQYLMGSNYGDLDADGYADFYVGTGDPGYEMMVANRMFRNAEGRTFQDVTTAGGFGHVQKGHAISFGDADNDGDQDLLVNMGGATEADRARTIFFENPSEGHRWLTLRLEGTETNRAALGARVRVTVEEAGAVRTVHDRVSGGSSFGANSLQLEIGLGAATAVREVVVEWPASGRVQRFDEVRLDRVYRAVEGAGGLEPVHAPGFRLGGG